MFELIRYSRIQTYIFKPKTFLSFQEVNYQLRNNEIILLEEILYGDYFVDLVATHPNPFIQSKSVYDLIEPQRSVPYETRYNLDVLLQPQDVNPCAIEAGMKSKLSLGHWKDGKLIRTQEVVTNPNPFIQSKSVYDLVEPQRSVPYEPGIILMYFYNRKMSIRVLLKQV